MSYVERPLDSPVLACTWEQVVAAEREQRVVLHVLRFRRPQVLSPAPLVERALDAGYADQAHMTAEVTRLSGLSPVRFLKDRTPTAA